MTEHKKSPGGNQGNMKNAENNINQGNEKRQSNIYDMARKYSVAGLNIIPVNIKTKAPTISAWKNYQQKKVNPGLFPAWFLNNDKSRGIAIICGSISGNIEVLDFDQGGKAFPAWRDKISPQINVSSLPIVKTQSGGYHVYLKLPPDQNQGNRKLAMTKVILADGTPGYNVLIETRFQGGYVLAPPSTGYELIQGDLAALPEISPDDYKIIIEAAASLDEKPATPPHPRRQDKTSVPTICRTTGLTDSKKGRVYNNIAAEYNLFPKNPDIEAVLLNNGWEYTKTDDSGRKYFRRPGKTEGHSGTLYKGYDNGNYLFRVWTDNDNKIESGTHTAFTIYAKLEHNGNYEAAEKQLENQGHKPPSHHTPAKPQSRKTFSLANKFDFVDRQLILDICRNPQLITKYTPEIFISGPGKKAFTYLININEKWLPDKINYLWPLYEKWTLQINGGESLPPGYDLISDLVLIHKAENRDILTNPKNYPAELHTRINNILYPAKESKQEQTIFSRDFQDTFTITAAGGIRNKTGVTYTPGQLDLLADWQQPEKLILHTVLNKFEGQLLNIHND